MGSIDWLYEGDTRTPEQREADILNRLHAQRATFFEELHSEAIEEDQERARAHYYGVPWALWEYGSTERSRAAAL